MSAGVAAQFWDADRHYTCGADGYCKQFEHCHLDINPVDNLPGCVRSETAKFEFRPDVNMSESWRLMTKTCTGKMAMCAKPEMGQCLCARNGSIPTLHTPPTHNPKKPPPSRTADGAHMRETPQPTLADCTAHPVKDRCPLQWKPDAVSKDGLGCAANALGSRTCAGCYLCFMNPLFADGCHSMITDKKGALKRRDCQACKGCRHCAPKRSKFFAHRLALRRQKRKAGRGGKGKGRGKGRG